MAKGRPGMYLEGWKFGVYLLIPIVASVYYSDPKRQKISADYWQYCKYPANPNVGMKQQIEDLAKQQKQRDVYREQMKQLSQSAARAEQQVPEQSEEKASGRGWLGWIGLGGKASSSES
jgi:hypothetical protein